MTEPPVSVVIPAHNAEAFLADAIDSVLGQTVAVELIVVNDGSTDETERVIASYAGRLIHVAQDQRGLGAARNRGVAESSGEWIAFLDADDIWMPEKIALQLRAAADRPDCDMLFGHGIEFADPGTHWPARTEPFPAYCASAMMTRRTLIDALAGFDESGTVGEFLDWYSRARERGAHGLMIDQIVFHRRVHDANMTRVALNRREQYLDVLQAHLSRRRSER
ncbi:MAG TPA: glycosyltransferase family A protein [Allosphingosinicella sp.]|nr:glycosyltransferase family A protein [Allosphingosinicella sp.]